MTESAGQRVARLQWDARRIEEIPGIPGIRESREFVLNGQTVRLSCRGSSTRGRVRIPKKG